MTNPNLQPLRDLARKLESEAGSWKFSPAEQPKQQTYGESISAVITTIEARLTATLDRMESQQSTVEAGDERCPECNALDPMHQRHCSVGVHRMMEGMKRIRDTISREG
jgi:hypothetical protein